MKFLHHSRNVVFFQRQLYSRNLYLYICYLLVALILFVHVHIKQWNFFFYSPKTPNSQSELLKCLDGEQRGGGVPLLDLHLIPVLHQGAADELVQQGLFGQVHSVCGFQPTSIFTLNVPLAGAHNKDSLKKNPHHANLEKKIKHLKTN